MRTIVTLVLFVIISVFSSLSFSKSEPLTNLPKSAQQEKHKVSLEGKCLHCHGGGRALQQDLSQPECQECHGEPTLPSEPVFIEISEPQEIIQQKLIHIPAGSYVMGSPGRPAAEGRGNADEGPPHEVRVDDFYIDLYETTNAHFQAYLDATGAKPPLLWRGGIFPEAIANHPVVYVSWHDAEAFCSWAGKRLPHEKEWEKAARGTDGQQFPWGNKFDIKNANTPARWKTLEEFGDTTPVGAFTAGVSPYGVFDTSGNVWEWTSSWYNAYPGNKTKSENYGTRYKTLKGGSWFDCSFYKCGISAPVYNRAFFAKRTKNDTFGFRCANNKHCSIIY